MIDFNTLHPAIREMVPKFIEAVKNELGIDLLVTSGMRTFEQQQALYDQGRAKPGQIVTKAKPGTSFHNYGLAIDIVPLLEGKPNWKSKDFARIAEIGKRIGFSWGGDWKSFKDLPHFEYPPNTSYRALLDLHNSGKVDSQGFVLLDGVSND